MNNNIILLNLQFVDEVKAKRQVYYVYEGKRYYIAMTSKSKKKGFDFNAITKLRIDSFLKKFASRKNLTSKNVVSESKGYKDRLDVLNILYVLCALKKATIDHRFKGRSLCFNIYGK